MAMRSSFNRHAPQLAALVALAVMTPAMAEVKSAPKSLSAGAILKNTEAAEGYQSCYAEMTQIITTSGDQKRTLVLRTWAVDDGDRQLAEYLSPPDIKGQRILMTEDGDNIWTYNPETRRTRKLGSHMKRKRVMGSDFSYEDQSGGKISEKYVGTILGREELNGVDCHVLDLHPTPEGPSYARITAWIAITDFVIRRMDYYRDDERRPFKRLIAEDIRPAQNRAVPHRLTMRNLEDGTETVNLISRIQFDVEIPASVFEARNLER